ncbi:MAG: hypothetical protein WC496_10770 [Phycisphaerae bacterium]|jgi:hypothetical protein
MKTKITSLLLLFCIASMAPAMSNQPVQTMSRPQDDTNGPMVILKCEKDGALVNSTPDFMYFVPLISPTLVSIEVSEDNKQTSGLICCDRKSDSKYFYVRGEFEMRGSGSYKNVFDPAGMIARNTNGLAKDAPLKNILGYIKFEGEGFGWIEITGKIENGKATATEVKVHFNDKGCTSPVTVGLYSVKCVNGQYKYENCYNEIVARVDTLTFGPSVDNPRMDIAISSLYSADADANGLWGSIKATVANFFINPLEIDKLGNDTMLDFGSSLFREAETFTFPKAKNLKPEANTQD